MEYIEIPKKRKRTKQLINGIKDLIEFYFSDANLRHDRFLRKEIEDSKSQYINLEILLKFNKIKELSDDLQVLVKATENSKLLELNKDKTKVKRCIVIPPLDSEEADSRTVYVEQLHAFCDHDWLRQVFTICGKVQYVSLPRYKHDGKIKGFAFVEFSNPEEAKTACKILNTAERKSSISTDGKIKNNICKRRRSVSVSESETETNNRNISTPSSKRNRSVSECSNENGNESPVKIKKKRKSSIEERLLSDVKGQLPTNETVKKSQERSTHFKEEKTEKKTEIEIKTTDDKDNVKKKNRKHSKKDKEVKEIVVPPLYVISKEDWTVLKRKYKHLQRKEFQNLKKTTKILKSELVRRKELKEKLSKTSQSDDKSAELTTTKAQNSIGEKRKLESNPQVKQEEPEKKISKNEYALEPGSVMTVSTETDLLTKDIIRKTLAAFADVAYVDYINGSLKGYVRFKSKEDCSKIESVSEKENWQFKMGNLKDQEEKMYFQKAIEDRNKRYELNEKKKKKRQERGTIKVLKQAEDLAT